MKEKIKDFNLALDKLDNGKSTNSDEKIIKKSNSTISSDLKRNSNNKEINTSIYIFNYMCNVVIFFVIVIFSLVILVFTKVVIILLLQTTKGSLIESKKEKTNVETIFNTFLGISRTCFGFMY